MMPILAGNKHLSINFFPHSLRLFQFSTEKARVQSIRIGHQSAFSSADTKNNIVNKYQTFIYNKKVLIKLIRLIT